MLKVLLLAAAATAQTTPTQTVVELAVATPTLSTLVVALTNASLVTTLSGAGPFTVFAPTNAAFAALPATGPTSLSSLLEPVNIATLQNVLKYHVVSGKILAAAITNNQVVETLATAPGNKVSASVNADSGKVFINAAQVTTADVEATNGVVHIINAVLIPPTQNIVALAQATTTLSTLVSGLVAANLTTTLSAAGPFTVFAPTNAAFTALPSTGDTSLASLLEPANKAALTSVLTYHVVSGNLQAASIINNQLVKTLEGSDVKANIKDGSLFINTAKVTTADVEATNGVVHIINAVLIPNSGLAKSFSAFAIMVVLAVSINLM